jgi:hypothetical protein
VTSELEQLSGRLLLSDPSAEETAEFIRLIQQESTVSVLERLLPKFYSEFGGLILTRIAELLPREDPQLYLSLALSNHRDGYDDEALRFLEKARSITPFDQETLRCDLWLTVANGHEDAAQKCRTLLQIYPDDNWAAEICQLIAKENHPSSIESPQWNNPWEDLINGRRPLDNQRQGSD